MDPCVPWCMEEKRQDPVNLIRSDFILQGGGRTNCAILTMSAPGSFC
jgi:hypothetical protein